jgi:DNA mismatch endonuclease, patch repair protein
MQSVRQKDTKPEGLLQDQLHALGLEFETNARLLDDLRRRVDIAFRGSRVAVQVHGCFWHSCPEHATVPKSNKQWWEQKLAANRDRDDDTERRLRRAGWRFIRIWEHEDMGEAAQRIKSVLEDQVDPQAPVPRRGPRSR